MAVLGLAEAGMRSTLALRDHAAETAAAEGAAEVAINQLRTDGYVGSGNCFGATGNSLPLDGFYPRSGTSDSARVDCTNDATVTTTPGQPVPEFAVLALADNFASLNVNRAALLQDRKFVIKGSVHANSRIGLGLLNNLHLIATPVAAGVPPTITANRPTGCHPLGGNSDPDCVPNQPDEPDPRYDEPPYAVPMPTPTVPTPPTPADATPGSSTCPAVRFHSYAPGSRFTNPAELNRLTDTCAGMLLHFQPGVYYLDFPSSGTPWRIRNSTVVAGNAPGIGVGQPRPCTSPFATTTPGLGVEFVLSQNSRIEFGQTANAEFCGSYSVTRPPIVFHGLRQDVTFTPPILPLPRINCPDGDEAFPEPSCRLTLSTAENVSRVLVNGTIYAPTAKIELNLSNNPTANSQSITGGVIVRKMVVNTARLMSATDVTVTVPPQPPPVVPQTAVWLNVYVCVGQPSCPAGSPNQQHALRVKVFLKPSATPPVTVLSWSRPAP
jgi:hypothetical protein